MGKLFRFKFRINLFGADAHYSVGKLCIEVDSSAKIAFISEELCIGCGICPKK
jgi:hypothetical protein